MILLVTHRGQRLLMSPTASVLLDSPLSPVQENHSSLTLTIREQSQRLDDGDGHMMKDE